MPMNPVTGLEEENVLENTSPVTTDLQGNLSTGLSPLTEIKQPEVNQNVPETEITKPENVTNIVETEETIKTPEIKPLDSIEQKAPGTGIKEVDIELDKIRDEKEKKIKETYDTYNLGRGQFQKNKESYINFDDINTKFEGVLSDLRIAQQSQDEELSEDQYGKIASKYGLSIEDVKNPNNIFQGLELSDKGRKEFGQDRAQDSINRITEQFERQKTDLQTNIDNQREQVENQTKDVQRSLDENLKFMTAQGVWSGADRSSGYNEGINNIKNDSQRTIDRLQQSLDKVEDATELKLERLTKDYNKSYGDAKSNLETELERIRSNTGIQLNGLTEKYGVGNNELTKALDIINEEFGTKSLDVYSKYINNIRQINEITNANIDKQLQLEDNLRNRSDRRFNELISNNGLLLQNTSLNGLLNNVEKGDLTIKRFNDLKNVIKSSITSTLGELGTVNQADLNTIDALLEQGQTPTQIVAQMQSMDKFKPKPETDKLLGKTVKTDDGVYQYNPETTRYDIRIDEEPGAINVGERFTSPSVSGTITQSYGTKSPLLIDNVELANGQVGTPGVDIAGVSGSNIKSFTNGEVVSVTTGKTRGDSGYGNQVVIRDQNGLLHMYNHLGNVNVQAGDTVDSNTNIGTMGNSGQTIGKTGTHLDYRVSDNGQTSLRNANWIDPSQFMGTGELEIDTFDEFDIPLYKKFNTKGLTKAEQDAIPNLEEFKRKALVYGKQAAKPGYKQIKRMIELAESLKDLGPLDRQLPDNATDIAKLLDRAGMQELVRLKQSGATFGSLTEKEFERIQNSIISVKPLTSAGKWNQLLDEYITVLNEGLPEAQKDIATTEKTDTIGEKDLFDKYY